jgi:hypothetical protein
VYEPPIPKPSVMRFLSRSVSEFMIESADDDSQMNGCTPAMRRPVGPRFGARSRSRFDPFVPV